MTNVKFGRNSPRRLPMGKPSMALRAFSHSSGGLYGVVVGVVVVIVVLVDIVGAGSFVLISIDRDISDNR